MSQPTEEPTVHVVTQVPATPPPPPSPTKELEREADVAIAYLARFTQSPRLDAELRMAMNDIQNTIKTMKGTIVRQSREAKENHERLVQVIASQRHH